MERRKGGSRAKKTGNMSPLPEKMAMIWQDLIDEKRAASLENSQAKDLFMSCSFETVSRVLMVVFPSLIDAHFQSCGAMITFPDIIVAAYHCDIIRSKYPPRTSNENKNVFDKLAERVIAAMVTKSGMAFSPSDVNTWIINYLRTEHYFPLSPNDKWAAVERFHDWMDFYWQPLADGSHYLDYKLDEQENYASLSEHGEILDSDKLQRRLISMSLTELEEFAETQFLCMVATVNRIRKSNKAGLKMTLNLNDIACICLIQQYAKTDFRDCNNSIKGLSVTQKTNGTKRWDFCGTEANLSVEEATHLLKTCGKFPNIKSRQERPQNASQSRGVYLNRVSVRPAANVPVPDTNSSEESRLKASMNQKFEDYSSQSTEEIIADFKTDEIHAQYYELLTAMLQFGSIVGVELPSIKDPFLVLQDSTSPRPFISNVNNSVIRLLSAAKEMLQEQKASIESKAKKLGDSKAKIDSLREEVAESKTQVKTLQEKQEGLGSKHHDETKKLLKKATAAKDRVIEELQAELNHGRELRSAREEKLSAQVTKLEVELDTTNHRLEESLKKPDQIREEFSEKIQKLHDKVRDNQAKLDSEIQDHAISKLDLEATSADLEKTKNTLKKFKEQQKEFKEKGAEVKKERDDLRAQVQFLTLDKKPEAVTMAKSDKNALRNAEDRIAELERVNELCQKDIEALEDANAKLMKGFLSASEDQQRREEYIHSPEEADRQMKEKIKRLEEETERLREKTERQDQDILQLYQSRDADAENIGELSRQRGDLKKQVEGLRMFVHKIVEDGAEYLSMD